MPLRAVQRRTACVMLALTTRQQSKAASSTLQPSGPGDVLLERLVDTLSRQPEAAAGELRLARTAGPSTRLASVTVGCVPPRP